jgi:hypothetical protein
VTEGRSYKAEVGEYNDIWSYVIYGNAIAANSHQFSVRLYPNGGSIEDGPIDPLHRSYPSLEAAKAALPTHVEEANKRVMKPATTQQEPYRPRKTIFGLQRSTIAGLVAFGAAMVGFVWIVATRPGPDPPPLYPQARVIETKDVPFYGQTAHFVRYTCQASPQAVYNFYEHALTLSSDGWFVPSYPPDEANGVHYTFTKPFPWQQARYDAHQFPFTTVQIIAAPIDDKTVTVTLTYQFAR